MAPTSPTKRVTRARAAAKHTANDMDAPPKKAPASQRVGGRKVKAVTVDDNVAIAEKPATKAIATLAAAPRRRIKVAPLATPTTDTEEVSESTSATAAAPKNAARARKAASKVETKSIITSGTAAPATRTRKAASKTNKEDQETKLAPKPRGRPKKTIVEETQLEVEKPVRQTRKRADSAAIPTQSTTSSVSKTAAIQKKTVTFQDLPDGDKENQPMPASRGAGRKEATKAATGLRARPVRKPAATNTRKKPTTATSKPENQESRALTPKKITQVARSTLSDSEDELNGGKTPIRDLSQSPKRVQSVARSPSPVKKLDFDQSLSANPPPKASLMSPPRRLPQSPFKNSWKESPKRSEAVPIFPTLTATTSTSVANGFGSQQDSALQQSPKRGVMDSSIFSHSVAKMSKSPNKSFLLHSPARRLFSPVKQNPTPAHQDNVVTDTAISCSFMSSRSPKRSARVFRIADEEVTLGKYQEIDFDESVLNIRSPVKVTKKASELEATITEDETPLFAVDHQMVELSPAETVSIPETNGAEATHGDQNDATEDIEVVPAILDSVSSPEQLPFTGNAATYMLNSYTLRAEEDSSEDELQAEQTPRRPLFAGRPSLSTDAIRARMSTGFSAEAGSALGFTPLATQLSGWAASSPDKQGKRNGQQHSMFSPLAAQHVPGEVQISRQSTPLNRKSINAKQLVGLRKSTEARNSMAASVVDDSEVPSHFADEMAAKDLEKQVEGRQSTSPKSIELRQVDAPASYDNFEIGEQLIDHGEHSEENHHRETWDISESVDDEDVEGLTTDLIQEKALTDTAQLDFATLAQEAKELAPAFEDQSGVEELFPSENRPTVESAPTIEDVPAVEKTQAVEDNSYSSNSFEYGDENTVIVARPSDRENSPEGTTSRVNLAVGEPLPLAEASLILEEDVQIEDVLATPVRPNLSLRRFANTVVSKVPLRPEGDISPLKVSRKRSRSLSAGPGSAKKPLLEPSRQRLPKSNTVISFSPERNGFSRSGSVGCATPGQMSFVIDDFGDSTLDGIVLPDDEDEMIDDSGLHGTPHSLKSNKIRSSVAIPGRIPLKAVDIGVLYGAMVYVDVHTTEGADASGIFVELLTQMGAKCVREWKWNPRASISVPTEDAENAFTPAKIGITHVVYKDGGKRTLEKVRDANGAVCCVGVGWVLDCERESKWLDESIYAVDPAVLPRGGSRRRKSMEPRALINANGSVSAVRGRSISAEMTKEMREELVNTPIRKPLFPIEQPVVTVSSASDEEDGPGSPGSDFTTPEIAATPTGYVKYDPSTSMSPTTPYLMSQGAKLVQQSCPPKQSQQGLFESTGTGFPISGRIEDQPDESMRVKLEAARRRTMNWRPRVASPLGK